MGFEYTVVEYDDDGVEVDRHTGDDMTVDWDRSDVDEDDADAVALAIAEHWQPVHWDAHRWRVHVRLDDVDAPEAVVWDAASRARHAEAAAPTPRELAASVTPTALLLRRATEDVAGPDMPATLRLMAVASDLALGAAYVLNTVTADPTGTGRHNLQALRGKARHLISVIEDIERQQRDGRR